MILPINERWRINSDVRGWSVQRCKSIPQQRWVNVGQHQSLKAAVEQCYKLQLRTSRARSFDEAIEENKRIHAELCKALSPKPLDVPGETTEGTDDSSIKFAWGDFVGEWLH